MTFAANRRHADSANPLSILEGIDFIAAMPVL
jgi:hypothetical protein